MSDYSRDGDGDDAAAILLVRTQQPESECTQWTSQAYKRKEGKNKG